jgi:hypothetical protein
MKWLGMLNKKILDKTRYSCNYIAVQCRKAQYGKKDKIMKKNIMNKTNHKVSTTIVLGSLLLGNFLGVSSQANGSSNPLSPVLKRTLEEPIFPPDFDCSLFPSAPESFEFPPAPAIPPPPQDPNSEAVENWVKKNGYSRKDLTTMLEQAVQAGCLPQIPDLWRCRDQDGEAIHVIAENFAGFNQWICEQNPTVTKRRVTRPIPQIIEEPES